MEYVFYFFFSFPPPSFYIFFLFIFSLPSACSLFWQKLPCLCGRPSPGPCGAVAEPSSCGQLCGQPDVRFPRTTTGTQSKAEVPRGPLPPGPPPDTHQGEQQPAQTSHPLQHPPGPPRSLCLLWGYQKPMLSPPPPAQDPPRSSLHLLSPTPGSLLGIPTIATFPPAPSCPAGPGLRFPWDFGPTSVNLASAKL